MKLQFEKTHVDAVLPGKNHDSDTGMDVTCIEDFIIPAGGSAVVSVGLKFAFIEPGYWVKVEGRSGLGFKYGIIPHPGIIIKAIVVMLVLSSITLLIKTTKVRLVTVLRSLLYMLTSLLR